MLTVMLLGMGHGRSSVLNVYFRDVKHFVSIVMQALFYSAPIVYPVTLVPEHSDVLGVDVPVRVPVRPEPVRPLHRGVPRRALRPALPEPGDARLPRSCGRSACSLLGVWVFRRLEPRLAEEV